MKISLVLLPLLATSVVSARVIRGRSLQAFGMPCNDDSICGGGGCICDPGNVKPQDEGGFCYDPEVDYSGCCLCRGGGMPLPAEEPPEVEGTGGEGGDVVIEFEPDEPAKETIASKACTITSDERERVDCGDGEFCMLEAGECNTKIGIHQGTCMAVPEVCTTVMSPVCGCDQVTYSNKCEAHAEGVSVSRDGPCDIVTSAPPGASYCTYSPDGTCYKSGHPACCAEPGTCPDARPPCEIEETATEAVETAEVDATTTGSTVAAADTKATTATTTGSTVAAADTKATNATTTGSTVAAADTNATNATTTGSTVTAADTKAPTATPPNVRGDDVDESMEPDSSAGVPAFPISVAAGACLLMLVA